MPLDWSKLSQVSQNTLCSFVSGHIVANYTHVYGVFNPRPLISRPCTQRGGSELDKTAVHFKLSPAHHNVFHGKIGISAWNLNTDEAIFGDSNYGDALALNTHLKNARFTHRLPNTDSSAVYGPTIRGVDFEKLLSIDMLEIWGKPV